MDIKAIILFDGVCNLCNSTIQFIIKNDLKNIFQFASLQGTTGTQFLKQYELDITRTDSIILIVNNKVYTKSSAVLRIAGRLRFPINLLLVFLALPSFIRNKIYDYIAKNRYQWYGKTDSCWMPTPELKNKFLP